LLTTLLAKSTSIEELKQQYDDVQCDESGQGERTKQLATLYRVVLNGTLPDDLVYPYDSGAAGFPSRNNLEGAELSIKPADWEDYAVARGRYRTVFFDSLRSQYGQEADHWPKDWESRFDDEFNMLRENYTKRIRGADLKTADLRNANLRGAFLANAQFQERTNLSGSILSRAELEGTRFWKSGHLIFDGVILDSVDFGGADLIKAGFFTPKAREANFTFAKMDEVRFNGILGNIDLSGAWFLNTSLKNAQFRSVLTRAHFDNANLAGAVFESSDLLNATFDGSNLIGANLAGAKNVSQPQLNQAVGDASTQIPAGLGRPQHWLKCNVPFDRARDGWLTFEKSNGSLVFGSFVPFECK
jgi:uncharacterized protein YjbI with pentapeptide repeats